MVIQYLLLGCLACVVLHELILICVVLVLFMLTATRLFFYILSVLVDQINLRPINFVTDG
jgi:hypothetical protein